MSYYHLGGPSGVFAAPDVHAQEHKNTWRWIAVSLVLLLTLGMSGAVIKVFASVQQAQLELPKTAALAAPEPPKPVQPVILPVEALEMPGLQKELEDWSATKQSQWGFYVQSLDDDRLNVNINETKQLQMASLYKLFLLKPLAQKLPAEAWGTNTITERTYLACVEAMLAVSDNLCAEAIAGRLGWTSLHKVAQSDGYKTTTLNKTENLVSTPANVGLLLDRLYHGDGYDPKTKSIALQALARRKGTEAIRRACTGCTVYNKTGDIDGYKHDAAIVEKNGQSYIVVIFSKGSNWAELTEAAKLISAQL